MSSAIINLILCLITTTSILCGCIKEEESDCYEHIVDTCQQVSGKTNIRIKNTSPYNYCNVILNPDIKESHYGIIVQGEVTCYKPFENAYKNTYVQIFINGKEYKAQPIDHIGEPHIGAGNFTYSIGIPDINSDSVSIVVDKD